MQTSVYAEKEFIPVPVKLYRIGELVRHTPFSRQTLHNYTIMGLIKESAWTEGGHRLYDESVFERLARIHTLKQTKTLSEIQETLRKESSTLKGGAPTPEGSGHSSLPS